MSKLTESSRDLTILKLYLSSHCGIKLPRVSLVHSKAQDHRNSYDPRAFCAAQQGSGKILTAQALEAVTDECRYGILLHELGHIHLNAFGMFAEIEVDEWCVESVPEAGYRYKNTEYWTSLECGAQIKRRAKSLEHVSSKFIERLKSYGR